MEGQSQKLVNKEGNLVLEEVETYFSALHNYQYRLNFIFSERLIDLTFKKIPNN